MLYKKTDLKINIKFTEIRPNVLIEIALIV